LEGNGSLLDMRAISKYFPGVKALEKVDFSLKTGEVHALIGENGAGKSTLIKVLTGILKKDAGEIWIDGMSVDVRDPFHARKIGVSVIFQELSQIPTLTVAENIFLGQEHLKSSYFLDRNSMFEKTRTLTKEYGIDLEPQAVIGDLSPAKRQLAEIMKAVSQRPRILVMDEPSSSLTAAETEKLFEIIANFKQQGSGIIYVSHRMDEIFRIADRVAVLRDGRLIDDCPIGDLNMDKVVRLMVGREVEIYQGIESEGSRFGESPVRLEVQNLSRKGVFSDISFVLHEGEILGLAGLVGSGRSELVNCLFGVDRADSGHIVVDEQEIFIHSVRDALKHGIALLPESRHLQGLILRHTIERNIVLPILRSFTAMGMVQYQKVSQFVREKIEELDIKPPFPQMVVENLSGGNQQKVVIAKWLATQPKVLIVDEPTAGIDVHTKSEIHKLIKRLAQKGVSILMISSELPELISHSDRIMVMNKGRNLGIFNHQDLDQEKIMALIMNDIMTRRREMGATNHV